MSFVEALQPLLACFIGELRGVEEKPRLKMQRGRWICQSRDQRTGYGVNPAMAYGSWRALCGLPLNVPGEARARQGESPRPGCSAGSGN